MDRGFHMPVMAVLATTLFSTSIAVGQIDSHRARKTTPGIAGIGVSPRPSVRGQTPKISADPPFSSTVIIYYNASKKQGSTSVDAGNDGANQKKETIKVRASNAGQNLSSRISGRASGELQPLVIYYRAYGPQFVSTPSGARSEPKVKTEALARTTKTFHPLNAEPTSLSSFAAIGLRKTISEPNMDAVVPSKAEIKAVSSDRDVEDIIEASPVKSATIPAPITSTDTSIDLSAKLPESVPVSAPRDLPTDRNMPAATQPESEAVGRNIVSTEALDFNNSAVQLALNHQYTEAQALLRRAIDTQPSVARFHRNMSILYEKMNLIDKALASARTAEQLSPSDPFIVEQRCVLELEAGEPASAVVCYEKLNSIRPLDELSRTYLGIAMFKTGKVDESIALLEQAANSKPPLAAAINALGVAYFRKKRINDAAAAFKRSVEAAPDVPESRYNLAIAQLSLRNREGAISQYNILKEGSPEFAARLYEILFRDKIVVVPRN